MRNAARQLSDGLHLAGLQQLLAGALEQFLRFSLGSDVAGDLGKAATRAILIVYSLRRAYRSRIHPTKAVPPSRSIGEIRTSTGNSRPLRCNAGSSIRCLR